MTWKKRRGKLQVVSGPSDRIAEVVVALVAEVGADTEAGMYARTGRAVSVEGRTG